MRLQEFLYLFYETCELLHLTSIFFLSQNALIFNDIFSVISGGLSMNFHFSPMLSEIYMHYYKSKLFNKLFIQFYVGYVDDRFEKLNSDDLKLTNIHDIMNHIERHSLHFRTSR